MTAFDQYHRRFDLAGSAKPARGLLASTSTRWRMTRPVSSLCNNDQANSASFMTSMERLILKGPADDVPIVRIPKPEPLTAPSAAHLQDGQLACQNHPGTEATVRCTHCELVFCLECAHSLGLEGRQRRLFCPCCSYPCEMLAAKPSRCKGSIFFRLTQTVRIWLDRVSRRAMRPSRRQPKPATRPRRAA
jgi:hypothetical protein